MPATLALKRLDANSSAGFTCFSSVVHSPNFHDLTTKSIPFFTSACNDLGGDTAKLDLTELAHLIGPLGGLVHLPARQHSLIRAKKRSYRGRMPLDTLRRRHTVGAASRGGRKGRPVFIEGRLQLDTWDDKQSGQKRSRLRVVAENLQLLGVRQEDEAPASSTPSRGRSSKNASVPAKGGGEETDDDSY